MLNDGQWHLISDVEARMNLNASQSKEIMEFLKTYEFVVVDEKNRVKLKRAVREFLAQGVTS
jgi:hypothetical protein